MSDEQRYEDVPIDELDEWLRNRINEQIADALEYLALDAVIPGPFLRTARRLRVPYVPPED